jgi:transglutaminase-like putative cysteine protease
MTKDIEKIEVIYDYIINNITYDREKANRITGPYKTHIDEILRLGKGICGDFAVLFAAMLRSQGIPTQMIEGDVNPGTRRHAWNMVYTKERGWVLIGINLIEDWNLMDPTFGAAAGTNVDQFIGDGTGHVIDKRY